jgi:serine/threonine protein kinase
LLVEDFDLNFEILDENSDEYTIMSGGTASVVKGHIKTPSMIENLQFTDVAIKIMHSSDANESLKYEVSIMASLPASPYLVKLVGYSLNPIAVIMKYYPLSLADMILNQDFMENDESKLKCCIEIARGMELVHSKEIIHFDLKPGNFIEYGIGK